MATRQFGSVCCFLEICGYASPLSTIREIMQTKSTECMFLLMVVFNFICALSWGANGNLINDYFVIAPNALGLKLCAIQMLCYSPIPSLLLMDQKNPPQAVWHHLVLSCCTMVFEAKRRGVKKCKNIDYVTQRHTPHCWLPAKMMYPANSTKRFSWLTRSPSILLMKNVQICIVLLIPKMKLSL